MNYHITTKVCTLSGTVRDHFLRHLRQIEKDLSDMDPNLPILDVIVREHNKKRLNHHAIEEMELNGSKAYLKTVHPKYPSSVYFDGSIRLILPKKPLFVKFEGGVIDKALDVGFERLLKELETYKGKHFSGYSAYRDHSSIRDG